MQTTLEEASELITDGTHGSPQRTEAETGIPLLSAKNVFDGEIRWDDFDRVPLSEWEEFQKRVRLKKGDVLMTCVGSIGRAAVWPNEMPVVLFRSVAIIRPKESLLPEYLEYVIRSVDFQDELHRRTKRSSQGGVYLKDIKTMPIFLPTLIEQARIVRLLNEADDLRKLRAQADRRTADLIPALFHEMFGNPINNPKGWELSSFAEVGKLDRGRSKHRPRDESSLYGGAYPFIQTGDVANSNGVITTYTQTYSEKGLAQSRMWPAGTLCITIAANIGETAILSFPACFPDSLVGFVPGEKVLVDYVCQWLVTMQSGLEEAAPQVAQKNINLKILNELVIPVPPLSLQKEFAARVVEIRGIEIEQASSRRRLDDLFQSLLHRAFRGELSIQDADEATVAVAAEPSHQQQKALKVKHSKGIMYRRAALDCHVIMALQEDQNLGRTKIEKISHLIEYHCGVDLERAPVRDAAGPNDYPSRMNVESLAKKQKWYFTRTDKVKVNYLPGPEISKSCRTAENFLGERKLSVDVLISLMRPLDTERSQIVATLYAAWNDFLLAGKNPTDDELIHEVRYNWHPDKIRIPINRWAKALAWMRKNQLVPRGVGKSTIRSIS